MPVIKGPTKPTKPFWGVKMSFLKTHNTFSLIALKKIMPISLVFKMRQSWTTKKLQTSKVSISVAF